MKNLSQQRGKAEVLVSYNGYYYIRQKKKHVLRLKILEAQVLEKLEPLVVSKLETLGVSKLEPLVVTKLEPLVQLFIARWWWKEICGLGTSPQCYARLIEFIIRYRLFFLLYF